MNSCLQIFWHIHAGGSMNMQATFYVMALPGCHHEGTSMQRECLCRH